MVAALIGAMAFNDEASGGDATMEGQINIHVFELAISALQQFPARDELPALQFLGDYTLIDGWFSLYYTGRMRDIRASPPSQPAKTTHSYY